MVETTQQGDDVFEEEDVAAGEALSNPLFGQQEDDLVEGPDSIDEDPAPYYQNAPRSYFWGTVAFIIAVIVFIIWMLYFIESNG